MNDKAKKRAAAVAVAASLVGGFEGVRYVAYSDPVGIPTICFGETKGIRLGQKATREECMGMLKESLDEAAGAVERCTAPVYLPPKREAAFVSFTYNVGGARFCSSRIPTFMAVGKVVDACNELTRYVYAKGIKLPGLVRRREEERKLCMDGLV